MSGLTKKKSAHFHNKDRPVNAASGKDRCPIVSSVCITNILCGRAVEDLNVYSVGTHSNHCKCKEVIGKLN